MLILLTGATGLIGKELIDKLILSGHQLHILSRGKKNNTQNINYFKWDPEHNIIDKNAFNNVEAIINLAGANVGEKRWDREFKKEILDSRILSTRLLTENIIVYGSSVKIFINASAIGFYGNINKEKPMVEDDRPGDDFLASVVKSWEDELFNFPLLGIRKVALRLGIVLSRKGGALPKMKMPIKYGVGAPLASGSQYISWVDITDVVNAFIFSLENEEITGPYNVVSPNPVTNSVLTHAIAKQLNKPILVPNIPSFALKLMLGEFANSVIGGIKVSPKKLLDAGFRFQFPELEKSLKLNL
ncbi:MAG: TIGR01777 family protein [Opitutaceae bacterium]|nr:TIGR01777 family protein [Cytophagales bacterium]